jgi:hypothetical protein
VLRQTAKQVAIFLLRDEEVQAAILALVAGIVAGGASQPPQDVPPAQTAERQRPAWVLKHPGVQERLRREGDA